VNAGSTPNPTTTANSNPATTSTASASTSSTSSGSGGGSQPNPILAAYVVPSVLAGVTVLATFIMWLWQPEAVQKCLKGCWRSLGNCCQSCWTCFCIPRPKDDPSQSPEVHTENHGKNSPPTQNRGPEYAQQYASPPPPTPY
jgi:hypothetical protein